MSNNKLKGIFLSCLILVFTPQAKSKGYLGIASVSRGANSTNIKFSDNRPSREIVRGKTASFGVSALRSAGDFLGLFYSAFSGKPLLRNYNEPNVGDMVFYYDLSTSERVGLAMVAMGFVGAVVGFVLKLDIPVVVTGLAGFIYSTYKLYTKAEQGINIRPDGVIKFGYFKSKFGKIGLEGEGTILWPNGIGYEGLFENNRIKNNPNGKLILFPEEDGYTVEFPNTEISGKENEMHTFTNAHYFNNISYNGVNKLLRFADGDVFRGIPYGNAEGIYVTRNGSTIVRDTLRNVLLGKAKKTPDTEINSDEPICEGTINCEDSDSQIQKLQKN